jgi:hypothetical protein
MMPVTGPYTGTANPIRGVPGGGFLWIITAGTGALKSDGRLRVHVRGLVLADQAPVPPALQGTNPVSQFDAVVSCQTISAAEAATVTNVSTAAFPASTVGNADINATVSLPHPCIAPIEFVASPVFGWFAATQGVEARASSPRCGRAGSPQASPVPSRRRPLCGTSAVSQSR